MTIAHDFEYVRPRTLEGAVDALDHPAARVLAGGTDVVPWLRDDLIDPALLVDIKAIPGLGDVTVDGSHMRIGALVTFSDLISSPAVHEHVPMLGEMARQVASIGVRNRATVVGNVCSAVPSLDAGPALMVYDAAVEVTGRKGQRLVPLEDWFVGPRATRLRAGEVATGILLELPPSGHAGVFLKLARYTGEDLAQANLAVVSTTDRHHRLAFGAVAPTPVRARRIEERLAGRELPDDLVDAASLMVSEEIAPITDIRATAGYRTHMCRVMLRRGLRAARERLSGTGPPYGTHLI
jgi:CO/xanthine dehydrogenase FAD-binding subunit